MKGGGLLTIITGLIAAENVSARGSGRGPIHPFAKYKDLLAQDNARVAPTGASSVTTSAPTPARTPLECFQVAEPVLTPSGVTRRDRDIIAADLLAPSVGLNQQPIEVGVDAAVNGFGGKASSCSVVIMEHTFANSYGAPFVGQYTPPQNCDFDHVVINFTTLVRGRQFDRTGVMYLGDAEVWRTSTAEPTSYGIRWEWLKDMTAFLSLWKQPQTLVFDLENIVDGTYTGLLNTTLTATFFKAAKGPGRPSAGVSAAPPADVIIPISQRLGSQGKPSQFVYPAQVASNRVANFPRNANRAVFTVDVKGQGAEEFWWSNILQSAVFAFNDTYGEYPGYSPFREVQVLIDGHLAGVSWPFPVIYTGGIVPQLNRPIVGIQAFDILEHEIDISPFLPLLCDGGAHTFEIKVLGLDDDGGSVAKLSSTTDSEWYITGKIFVWVDEDKKSVTTGKLGPLYTQQQPTIALTQHLTVDPATGKNKSLEYNLAVTRSLSITSYVKTQRTSGPATWSQSLSYSNVGGVFNYGNDNLNAFSISGADAASSRAASSSYAKSYAYPLFANSTSDTLPQGNLTLWAQVDQGFRVEVDGGTVFPTGLEPFVKGKGKGNSFKASRIDTWRNGTASYYRPGDNSYSTGVGQTHQVFSLSGVGDGGRVAQLYTRDVSAYNNTVTDDHVFVAGARGGAV
ncbi:peptide N-acetyl-beta-D-glucosaminyl asparaginase amidase A-domain-containing protein [Xylariaceae sp. FL0594]|nr:peptide N-acetyl-beta-D-glucosaminyl asparaginase amidase A-domain-containing protein [Xylariaceae sp. FL0594]